MSANFVVVVVVDVVVDVDADVDADVDGEVSVAPYRHCHQGRRRRAWALLNQVVVENAGNAVAAVASSCVGMNALGTEHCYQSRKQRDTWDLL